MKRAKEVALPEEQFHAICRALADPRRFAILEQVAATDGLACSALQEHGVISPATISHHIKELHEAGLVNIKREGRNANLFLCRSAFEAYLKRLSSL
jgi:ArsR family transcriptional regulator, arsenate/arsenite/antimonite-responsive transcriptional repressor